MNARKPDPTIGASHHDAARRRQEIEWTLDAVVGAIVAGKLPPDDAAAWARIAAYEVQAQSGFAIPS
jgi:hypothetical protein